MEDQPDPTPTAGLLTLPPDERAAIIDEQILQMEIALLEWAQLEEVIDGYLRRVHVMRGQLAAMMRR